MQEPLWEFDELVAACGGAADGEAAGSITGISIDTRTLQPGDVFVALKDQRDGHEFVAGAFEKGAVAAVVSKDYARTDSDGALVRADDPLHALQALGRAARARLSDEARVIAVTGSAGKTSTKDMLRLALSQVGATHVSEKSYNNHWGVPLTLARMPASTDFGVFEVGMNHAGEISPLSQMVRPHAAVITTVAPVHLEFFKSVEDIARAKAEVFEGLESGGCAVLNIDNEHYDRLRSIAEERGARIVSFGANEGATCRLVEANASFDNSDVRANVDGQEIAYKINAPGAHFQLNSLCVLGACHAVGADIARCGAGFSEFEVPDGRGERLYVQCGAGQTLVIDESYNANPASVRAALGVLMLLKDGIAARRIAVLGDMLELGKESPKLHLELKKPIADANVDLVFACGPNMKHLFDALPKARQGGYALTAEELEPVVVEAVKAGDVVVVKGSLGSRMGGIVRALKIQLASRPIVG